MGNELWEKGTRDKELGTREMRLWPTATGVETACWSM